VTDFLPLLLAFAAGASLAGAVAWLTASASSAARSQDAERRAAASDARAQELRQQITLSQQDLQTLRDHLSRAEQERAAAETNARNVGDHAEAQRRLLDEAKQRLSDTFKSLAADALSGNTAGFLSLAEAKFQTLREEAVGDLDARKQAIGSVLAPLAQALDAYKRETLELEQRRERELGTIGEQLRQVASTHAQLHAETNRLVNALRTPHVRGRWGEIALRRTAEIAGMAAYCDFAEQETLFGDNGRQRPDMIVRLPANREVVVDSKVPLSAYLEAIEAVDESERLKAMTKHAQQIRTHVQKLAAKSYWESASDSAEFVVLFIPNDSFLAAAAERDPELVEWALAQGVILATPATFIALLRAIAFGWRQAKVAENAQRISDVGRELSERMAVLVDHLSKIGGSLGRAVSSYNEAVGSLESRVLPTVRKLDGLGAGAKRPVEELTPLDLAVRELTPSRLELD